MRITIHVWRRSSGGGDDPCRLEALHRLGRVPPCLVVVTLAAALLPLVGSAHEQRDVGDGRYSMTVGFINEPAYVGLENGLYLKVVNLTGDRSPVEGLAGTLAAEVTFGDRTAPLSLAAVPDDPGVYQAWFIPTAAGDYTFRVAGQIEDQAIDETFRSAPDTFDSIQSASVAQFPEPVPAGADLADELGQATDDASSARTLAIVGILVGAAGLIAGLGAVAASMRRRPR
jgi:hypothetical protein